MMQLAAEIPDYEIGCRQTDARDCYDRMGCAN